MAKIRKTKNELKAQKEALERYERFLPTLELKKAQLIAEIKKIGKEIDKIRREMEKTEKDIQNWVAVYSEDIDLNDLFEVKDIVTGEDNIAGIDIEVFEDIDIEVEDYDYFKMPLWIDRGLEEVIEYIKYKARIVILERTKEKLDRELTITMQRINLFEKVKIPETKENIKTIQIYLDDRQTQAVVRGKISKKKIQQKKEQAAV
ncbi:MAG: V-type ATP synthase subunit D [Candidatus Marinimicrobia bacterium]|nr:V-type ATP synthase subunit D [Candidatus Neomarinimicrobiota bacterium]